MDDAGVLVVVVVAAAAAAAAVVVVAAVAVNTGLVVGPAQESWTGCWRE